MRASGAAGRAYFTNELAPFNHLRLANIDVRKVSITSCKATAVIDNYQVSIAVLHAGKGDFTALYESDIVARNVDPELR